MHNKKTNKIIISLIIVVIIFSGLYYYWTFSRIPRGLNITSVNSIKFDNNYDFSKAFPEIYIDDYGKVANIEPIEKESFLYVKYFQFNSSEEAEERFESSKEGNLYDNYFILYKEENNGKNRYYISYETTHIHWNHIMPSEIDRIPNVSVNFLKNNLLITLTYWPGPYTDIDYDPEYVEKLNVEIEKVSKVLGELIIMHDK